MKTVKHKENINIERNSNTLKECKAKKVQNEKTAARRKHGKWKNYGNTKQVQRGKNATWRKYRDRAKFGKKCKRRVHYSAQTDNGPLYTGSSNYTML